MIQFSAELKKFNEQAEKTGWTYLVVSEKIAGQLNPGCKKSFRVKGSIDQYKFDGISLLPMGEGSFIIAVNATIRRAIRKEKGAKVTVKLELQKQAYQIAADFMECLEDEPTALEFFNSLTGSHRNYFSKWIESAKTEGTRIKRISMAVNALAKKWGYPEMIRAHKRDNDERL